MHIHLEATWDAIKISCANADAMGFDVGVFAWKRTGPFPFVRPDGRVTNVYGPFEWVPMDPRADADGDAGEGRGK